MTTSRRLRAANLGLAIGNELRRHRHAADRSQADVALASHLARPIYARLERGYHEPTLSTLLPVCRALRVNPIVLLDDALRRAEPPRAVHPGMHCSDCPFFPRGAAQDEGGECEHPYTLPEHGRAARHLHVKGDASPPSACPIRRP